jgi:hypothetical protein
MTYVVSIGTLTALLGAAKSYEVASSSSEISLSFLDVLGWTED